MGIMNRKGKVPQNNGGAQELTRIAKETGLAEDLVADVLDSAAQDQSGGGWQLGGGEIRRTSGK